MRLRIIIADEARPGLKSITSFVSIQSESRARTLRKKIVDSKKELAKNPQKYPPDKFQKKLDSTVRAFELYHIRITYSVSSNKIVVLRIRHTTQNPLP